VECNVIARPLSSSAGGEHEELLLFPSVAPLVPALDEPGRHRDHGCREHSRCERKVTWEPQPHDSGDEANCDGHRPRRVGVPTAMHEPPPPRDRLLCKWVGHRVTGRLTAVGGSTQHSRRTTPWRCKASALVERRALGPASADARVGTRRRRLVRPRAAPPSRVRRRSHGPAAIREALLAELLSDDTRNQRLMSAVDTERHAGHLEVSALQFYEVWSSPVSDDTF